jgi:ankyrin repeat protein
MIELAENHRDGYHFLASKLRELQVRPANEVNINAFGPRGEGETALMEAVQLDNLPIVQALLDRGANVHISDGISNYPTNPLHSARSREIVSALVAHGADVKSRGIYVRTALHNVPTVQAAQGLLDLGAEINVTDNEGNTPLHMITKRNYQNDALLVAYLIARGADVNAINNDGNTPLHYAENLPIAICLVKGGADVNAYNQSHATPLHLLQNPQVIEYLITNKANIDAREVNGRTPLFYIKNEVKVPCLVAHGADINARDHHGNTPIYYAEDKGILECLIAHGADTNVSNNQGHTPLHRAKNIEFVKILIKHIKTPNILDYKHCTPLHHIVREAIINREEGKYPHTHVTRIIKHLLKAGDDPRLRNQEGNTPAEIFIKSVGNKPYRHKKTPYRKLKILRLLGSISIELQPITEDMLGEIYRLSATSNDNPAQARPLQNLENALKFYKNGINEDKDLNFEAALATAIWMRKKEIVQVLLEQGVDMDKSLSLNPTQHRSPFMLGLLSPDLELRKMLMTWRSATIASIEDDIDKAGCMLFTYLVQNNDVELARYVIELMVKRFSSNNVISKTWAQNKHALDSKLKSCMQPYDVYLNPQAIEAIRNLVNAHINKKNDNSTFFLHQAAISGHVEMVQYLLEMGANPYQKDHQQNTALVIVQKQLAKIMAELSRLDAAITEENVHIERIREERKKFLVLKNKAEAIVALLKT